MNDRDKIVAYQFIVLMGLVSLFGDVVYEGARSVTGPYLRSIGAGVVTIGIVAGLGEFLGYGLRASFGYIADKLQSYWFFTFLGYCMLGAVPLLAFTDNWQLAVVFILMERIGKAIRSPSRDVILSHATVQVGRGWGFGIHEALDQIGAIIGPLIFFIVLSFQGTYKMAFAILGLPFVGCISILTLAKIRMPYTTSIEVNKGVFQGENKRRFMPVFWLYSVFTFLCVGGLAHFQLISYHINAHGILSDATIPKLYTIAMAVDAVVALIIGKLYDKVGLRLLLIAPIWSLLIPILTFSQNGSLITIGIILWGGVMGIHETIMRAAVAELAPIEKRGTAYGLFNTIYGGGWLLGSVCMGWLYKFSVTGVILFVLLAEIIALLVFMLLRWKVISQA